MLARALIAGVVEVGKTRCAGVAHAASRTPGGVEVRSVGVVLADDKAAGNGRVTSNGMRLVGSASFEAKYNRDVTTVGR